MDAVTTGDAISAALPKNGVCIEHRKALPHVEVGAALSKVRESGAYRGLVLAFEFLVLTAGRSGEVRAARWDEIDREAAVWTIPGERMKAGREHRVPLAAQALDVLDQAGEPAASGGLLFPSATGRMLSQTGMPKLLHQLNIDAVPHGFRSSFRDWAAECTDVPREVCELALAHVNRDRVEAAYRRSDLFEKRRGLMADWAARSPLFRSNAKRWFRIDSVRARFPFVPDQMGCTLVPGWHIRGMIQPRISRNFDLAHSITESIPWRCAFDCPAAAQRLTGLASSFLTKFPYELLESHEADLPAYDWVFDALESPWSEWLFDKSTSELTEEDIDRIQSQLIEYTDAAGPDLPQGHTGSDQPLYPARLLIVDQLE